MDPRLYRWNFERSAGETPMSFGVWTSSVKEAIARVTDRVLELFPTVLGAVTLLLFSLLESQLLGKLSRHQVKRGLVRHSSTNSSIRQLPIAVLCQHLHCLINSVTFSPGGRFANDRLSTVSNLVTYVSTYPSRILAGLTLNEIPTS